MTNLKYDEIGYWSELKLDIVREYAKAYSVIMNRQRAIKKHIYIDAFAGAGHHISKTTKEFVQGSPLNALLVEPRFSEFHLIDLDGDKTEALRRLTKENPNVYVYSGDANQVLLQHVFPRSRYTDFHRALCFCITKQNWCVNRDQHFQGVPRSWQGKIIWGKNLRLSGLNLLGIQLLAVRRLAQAAKTATPNAWRYVCARWASRIMLTGSS